MIYRISWRVLKKKEKIDGKEGKFMVNKKCHVFTPIYIVNKMLDAVGYTKKLFGKSFLENSCGDGQILCEAVKRYIEDCKKCNIKNNDIVKGLETDFFAVEYDEGNFEKCRKNLDMIAKTAGFENVQWNIVKADFLTLKINQQFDFIVGNPPYISYANIDVENRKYIRDNFESCKKGKFDYCYPFIELSLKYLNSNGKMAYLIPTNIFKNVFAKDLRCILLDKVKKIVDYTTEKIFKNVLTSSSIIVCETGNKTNTISYYDVSNKKSIDIYKKKLGNKWIFDDKGDERKILFSEYFLAATSVATLLNEAFVIKKFEEKEKFFLVDNVLIEKGIVKPAVSPRTLSRNIRELIIFPYEYCNGRLIKFEIETMGKKYPGVMNHLKKFKKKLDLRDFDHSSKWFEYGRSQALENLNQRKLLMSFIVTNKVNVYEIDENTIPYSGIYVIPKSNLDLSVAKEILESEEFLDYVKKIGIYVSGSSLRITANDIKNFDISKWRAR